MLAKTRILAAILLAGALAGPAAAARAQGPSDSEASLLRAINLARAQHGVPPLRVDFRLSRAARGHSADMLRRQYFAHGSVTGRALAVGARGPVFGEDLAWATDLTPGWVVEHWLASPRHRAVMLRPGFRRIGIGINFGAFGGNGGAGVVTADFAGR
jgi:uncharacterized protein YkwD